MHHPTKRQASKSDCLIEHPFLIEKKLIYLGLGYDVELESRPLWLMNMPTPQIRVRLTLLMIRFKPRCG